MECQKGTSHLYEWVGGVVHGEPEGYKSRGQGVWYMEC